MSNFEDRIKYAKAMKPALLLANVFFLLTTLDLRFFLFAIACIYIPTIKHGFLVYRGRLLGRGGVFTQAIGLLFSSGFSGFGAHLFYHNIEFSMNTPLNYLVPVAFAGIAIAGTYKLWTGENYIESVVRNNSKMT